MPNNSFLPSYVHYVNIRAIRFYTLRSALCMLAALGLERSLNPPFWFFPLFLNVTSGEVGRLAEHRAEVVSAVWEDGKNRSQCHYIMIYLCVGNFYFV